jgi:hypothetical protein
MGHLNQPPQEVPPIFVKLPGRILGGSFDEASQQYVFLVNWESYPDSEDTGKPTSISACLEDSVLSITTIQPCVLVRESFEETPPTRENMKLKGLRRKPGEAVITQYFTVQSICPSDGTDTVIRSPSLYHCYHLWSALALLVCSYRPPHLSGI